MITDADLSSNEYKHKVIPSLDVAKFVCAIMVVIIHTQPLKSINLYLNYGVVQYIARLAVPFFFVTSGYLCFRKTDYENFDFKIPFNYAMRILKLYLLWTLVYCIPFGYKTVYKNGIIRGTLSAIRTFVFSGYHHLWYLSGLVVAVLLVAVALKLKFKIKTILFIGFGLYLLGLLGQSYFFIIKPLQAFPILWNILRMFRKVIVTTRDGLFEGVLYVSIGMMFAYRKIIIKYAYVAIGFLVSMLFGFAEVFVIKYYDLYLGRDIYLFLLPSTFFMFYLVAHIEIKQTRLTNTLRTYSMLIYYTHSWINFPIVSVINKICERINGIEDYEIHSLLRFAIVLSGAAIASKLIIVMSSKERFKWVRKMY